MIYKQERVGQYGRPFILYKLKTMRDVPGPPSTSADDPRITRVGRVLRKYKLDEIPQFFNVLKGDMAIFGPRPTIREVINSLTDDQKDVILSVKPGLFDLATLWNINEEEALKGENDPHKAFMEKIYPEMVRLQIEYINKKSTWLNLKIIGQTIRKLLSK